MLKYNQKFGILGAMIKSEGGVWCKSVEAEALLEQHDIVLLKVIEDRNADIEKNTLAYVNALKERNDDIEGLQASNRKLVTISVISATLNVLIIAFAVLTALGKI